MCKWLMTWPTSLDFIFFKEGKKGHILLFYSLDVELVEAAEKTVLQKFAGKSFVKHKRLHKSKY